MIRISCNNLEQVREAPAQHGRMIATVEKPQAKGSYGMFACWQDTAKLVHTGKLTITEAVAHLQNKFLRFNSNLINSRKQAKLTEQLISYCAQFEKNKFEFVDSKHHMNWDIVDGVRLTGNTPWVVHNKDGYYAYITVEHLLDWERQLRFPLIQQYLTDNHIDCAVTDMRVGIYCLEANRFEFKSYSTREIRTFISETGEIFEAVLAEYNKWKR